MATKKKAKKSAPKKHAATKHAPKKAAKTHAAAKTAPKKAAKAAKAPAKAAKAPHQIVHWEIQAQDPAALHDFYSSTFGWTINANNPMNYGMVSSGGSDGIDGGIGPSQHPGVSRVLVYTSVPDINAMLQRIEAGGGKTVMPRDSMGPVVMALFADPEGNVFGLVED